MILNHPPLHIQDRNHPEWHIWFTNIWSILSGQSSDSSNLGKFQGPSVLGVYNNALSFVAALIAGADGAVLRRAAGEVAFGSIPESSVTNLVSDLAAITAAINLIFPPWDNLQTYKLNYPVFHNGVFYVSNQNGNIGLDPATHSDPAPGATAWTSYANVSEFVVWLLGEALGNRQ